MSDQRDKRFVQESIDSGLSVMQGDPWLAQRIMNQERTGGFIVKKRLSVGLVLAIVLMLITVTALAVVLLTPKEVVEQVAVPLAQENDMEGEYQDTYSKEELAQLIKALNENGITIEENNRILRAIKSGKGYWEDETIMEICRQAFGRDFTTWTIEEKHWYEEMMVNIGFSEYNCYLVPGEGDMTVSEARAYAAQKLNEEYSVNLPEISNDDWRIEEWFFQYRDEEGNLETARWQFEYVNKNTGIGEYIVEFTRDGEVVDISESGFHGGIQKAESFSLAERIMEDRYGEKSNWSLEAWPEFGQMISGLTPETDNQRCYLQAGYCLLPEGHIGTGNAEIAVRQAVGREGAYEAAVFCCMDGDTPIFKVNLRYPSNDGVGYDAIWCGEVDCLTGELRNLKQYIPGTSPMIMQFVPFSVVQSVKGMK